MNGTVLSPGLTENRRLWVGFLFNLCTRKEKKVHSRKSRKGEEQRVIYKSFKYFLCKHLNRCRSRVYESSKCRRWFTRCRIRVVSSERANTDASNCSHDFGTQRQSLSHFQIQLDTIKSVSDCTFEVLVGEKLERGVKNSILWTKAKNLDLKMPKNHKKTTMRNLINYSSFRMLFETYSRKHFTMQ